MASGANAPVIIKRKKVIAGGDHHGGAWKVAYADFVTAMMAFFMLMWLLNATSEQTKTGLADYFSPTIPVAKISGGGSGALYGHDALAVSAARHKAEGGAETEDDALEAVAEALTALAGESMVADAMLRHIITRVTDEGLIVDLIDLPGARIFEPGGTTPTVLGRDLLALVGQTFALSPNAVAVEGHVRADPVVLRDSPVWDLSTARARAAKEALVTGHVDHARLARISGAADREPLQRDRMDVRNNRLELVLLRHLPKA